MADARIFHKRASGGERVCALEHLEHRVWVQYVLSADDYGVLRETVSGLRHDNPRLEKEPIRRVENALRRVIEVGLVLVFTHQGARFLWQPDWQDFQGVRYPRATVNPAPAQPELDRLATALTRKLFTYHPQYSRQRFGDSAETSPTPARSGAARNPTSTSAEAEGSQRETIDSSDGVAPAWSHRRSGALARSGGLVGDHGRCDPVAAAACARGVCVPGKLVSQWRQQYGDDVDPCDTAIRTTVARELSRLPASGGVAGDLWRRWADAWTETHGGETRQSGSRTGDTIDAGKQHLTKRLRELAEEGGPRVVPAIES